MVGTIVVVVEMDKVKRFGKYSGDGRTCCFGCKDVQKKKVVTQRGLLVS